MSSILIIGSRGSELALWQANFISRQLKEKGIASEVKIIKTQGDKVQDIGFDKMEGKGFFTKELEEALLNKEIDLAVHSHKDLPTTSPEGLVIAAVSKREDASELLLIHPDAYDDNMPFHLKRGTKVGTSSARRKSQFLALRPDCELVDLRGNVPTRVGKVILGEYPAILIANAGIERLELDLGDLYVEKLKPNDFIPAPAQGVLALQCRANDPTTLQALESLNDAAIKEIIDVERKVLNLFDGGCQLPLGVYCEKDTNEEDEIIYKVWASKAEASDKKPKYLYYESSTTTGLAEKMVERFNSIKPASVFLSRNKRKHDLFCEVLEGNGFSVTPKALIDFEIISIKNLPASDWIFFASKNAVKFFFEQKPGVDKGIKYAAVGKSTADEIRKYGQRAEFIGQGTDTRLIGRQFSALVGNRRVLFPQAKGSMRSIQQSITRRENAIDLEVYDTIQNEFALNASGFEILVFTSPSNVEAYLKNSTFLPSQKIVAMGDATANTIRKAGAKVHATPPSFTDMGLLQAVFKIS